MPSPRKRKPHRPKAGPVRIAKILRDAAQVGTEEAAQRHGVTSRTVRRYKAWALSAANDACDPLVSGEELAQFVRWTRHRLLSRIEELAIKSENLKQLIQAYKIVSDGDFADRIVSGGQPERDPGVEGPGVPPPPGDGRPDEPIH